MIEQTHTIYQCGSFAWVHTENNRMAGPFGSVAAAVTWCVEVAKLSEGQYGHSNTGETEKAAAKISDILIQYEDASDRLKAALSTMGDSSSRVDAGCLAAEYAAVQSSLLAIGALIGHVATIGGDLNALPLDAEYLSALAEEACSWIESWIKLDSNTKLD